MKYYPLFMDLKDKDCVVIGGGKVAERKVLSLLDAGAKVLVISPELSLTMRTLFEKRRITCRQRAYEKGDLKGAFLAFTVTDSLKTNEEIAGEAGKEGVLLNVVDNPKLCDFIVPAIVSQGDLSIAISTGGKSPALAKRIRKDLEERFGWEYGAFLDLLGAVRLRLLTKSHDNSYNKKLFLNLVSSPLLELIREGNDKEVDEILKEALGGEVTLSKLKVSIAPKD